jgi:hypothetical protein
MCVRQRALVAGYKSGLEELIAAQLKEAGMTIAYEAVTIPYSKPEKLHTYRPDWVLDNGIVVESKGRLVTEDRNKHRLVLEQYPDIDLRFVFSNPRALIGKKSATTYALWCERLGIKYAHRTIPEAWLRESPLKSRLDALKALGWAPSRS